MLFSAEEEHVPRNAVRSDQLCIDTIESQHFFHLFDGPSVGEEHKFVTPLLQSVGNSNQGNHVAHLTEGCDTDLELLGLLDPVQKSLLGALLTVDLE